MNSPLIDTLFRRTTVAPHPSPPDGTDGVRSDECGESAPAGSGTRTESAVVSDIAARETVDSTPSPAGRAVPLASAAPVRAVGVHTRAGNSMGRTRAALLDGAARAVAQSGTRITMAQVANVAGVAKATLYNHLRTRDAVLAALVADQVQRIIDAQAGKSLGLALNDTALAIAGNPVRLALADLEPAALARLARIDDGPGWSAARDAVSRALVRAGRGGTEMVLRWLCSFLVAGAEPRAISSDTQILLAGLPWLDRPGTVGSGAVGTA